MEDVPLYVDVVRLESAYPVLLGVVSRAVAPDAGVYVVGPRTSNIYPGAGGRFGAVPFGPIYTPVPTGDKYILFAITDKSLQAVPGVNELIYAAFRVVEYPRPNAEPVALFAALPNIAQLESHVEARIS